MTIRDHVKQTMTLAWPMMLAQGLSLMAYVIDSVMVGQAGGQELAYLSAGRSLILVVTMVGIGLLQGVVVLTARADGAENYASCGRLWKAGLFYAAVIGFIAVVAVSYGGRLVLQKFGLSDELVEGGGRFLAYMGFALPGTYLLVTSTFFLQGLKRTKPGMVTMMLITPLLIFLNWLLIYGNLGFPAMGAAGAGLATAICQWTGAIGLFIYVRRMPEAEKFGVNTPWKHLWRDGWELRRFGLPLGIAGGLEFLGMTTIIMFAGRIGEITISAIEIVFNMHLMAFVASFSIASATAVRVGNAVGRKDFAVIPTLGLVGAGLGVTSMLPFILAYVLAPITFFTVFTANTDIHVVALIMLPFLLAALPFDAVQFVFLHSLRAAGDQWIASILQVTAFLFIMATAGWVAAFPLGMGGAGLALAFTAGALSAAILLGTRFYFRAWRPYRQSGV